MLCRFPVRMAACAVVLGAACNGSIDGSNAPPGEGPKGKPPASMSGKPNVPDGTDPAHPTESTGTLPPLGEGPFAPDRSVRECQTIDPGPSPIRRLTRTEYDNA